VLRDVVTYARLPDLERLRTDPTSRYQRCCDDQQLCPLLAQRQNLTVLLLALLYLLVASVVVLVVLHRQNRLSRPALVAFIGLDVAMVGGLLTPGIAWGDSDTDSVWAPVGMLVFYAGVGVMIWAAVLWRRSRRSQPRPHSS